MPPLELTISDLDLHVAHLGLDVYPPINVAEEATRLSMFAAEARDAFPRLYEQHTLSRTDFSMSGRFQAADTPAPPLTSPTFGMTARGPVFIFPMLLPEPIGEVSTEEEWLVQFDRLRRMLFSSIPGRACIRLGLVRELGFRTGNTNATGILTKADVLGDATLAGGQVLLAYRDAKCNVRITIEPKALATHTALPIGQIVTAPAGYGLYVKLDINNHEIHALTDAETEEILDRACGFWPETLLDYLNSFGTT